MRYYIFNYYAISNDVNKGCWLSRLFTCAILSAHWTVHQFCVARLLSYKCWNTFSDILMSWFFLFYFAIPLSLLPLCGPYIPLDLQTVDQFFGLSLPMDITHLQALLSIIFHTLDSYLLKVVSQLGTCMSFTRILIMHILLLDNCSPRVFLHKI